MTSARQRVMQMAKHINANAAGDPERIEAWVKSVAIEIDGTPVSKWRMRRVLMMTDAMAAAANLRAMRSARLR